MHDSGLSAFFRSDGFLPPTWTKKVFSKGPPTASLSPFKSGTIFDLLFSENLIKISRKTTQQYRKTTFFFFCPGHTFFTNHFCLQLTIKFTFVVVGSSFFLFFLFFWRISCCVSIQEQGTNAVCPSLCLLAEAVLNRADSFTRRKAPLCCHSYVR